MNKSIDWNEVTVGETYLDNSFSHDRKVLFIDDPWVWVKDGHDAPHTVHKDELRDWTIYDPWEEITEECKFSRAKIYDYSIFEIRYQGKIVRPEDSQFKVGPGMRVWKRKEN